MKVRTRFAPSPTGFFHIAGLQKVLYSYALAKKNKGEYIVRVEDTDRNRFVEGAEDIIFESHRLMGIRIDESIYDGGDFGPYRQSERLEIYRKYAEQLIENGFAYYAFETKEELEEMRKIQKDSGHRPKYNGQFRDYPLADAKKRIKNNEPYVIRIKIPKNKEIKIKDLIMGDLTFNTNDLDDSIIFKSDGFPTYHLAVVVDDYLMKISHVFRGVEWISTTPIHYLLYSFFNWPLPKIGHIPNILNSSGKGKLSKRDNSVALVDFFEKGFLKEAIINFIILLGWSPPIRRIHGEKEREVFSLNEFIDLFNIKDLNKSNPKFNIEKLLWFNKEYIKNMDLDDLESRFRDWLKKYNRENKITKLILNDSNLIKKLTLVQGRVKSLDDIFKSIIFFYSTPSVDWNVKQLKKIDSALRQKLIQEIINLHTNLDQDSYQWIHADWEAGIRKIGDNYEVKHGDVFMVLRLAIVGSTFSPPLFEALQILGRNEALERLRKSLP